MTFDCDFVLKRGTTKLREVQIGDAASNLGIYEVEMGLRRTGNLSDAERVVRVWAI